MSASGYSALDEYKARLFDSLPAAVVECISQNDQQDHLEKWLLCSEFVANFARLGETRWLELVASGDLHQRTSADAMSKRVNAYLAAATDTHSFDVLIRQCRQREMARLIWRDAVVDDDLVAVLDEVTSLAEACIEAAYQFHYHALVEQWGEPIGRESGEPQPMVIIGMGKLGARELNFSSDIDLIFTYPEQGETQGRKNKSNEEFFKKLGQKIIASLNDINEHGFVYRVDMRLRPDGGAGKLALNFSAMETYYEVRGRDWERYAWIKGQVVAGDKTAGQHLLKALRPFVFRRYLDFGAFESLREMKGMIEAEVKRKNMQHNVKLGPGGIREIEFIGQAFQLIHGGREQALQQRSILQVINSLAELDILPDYVAREMSEAYVFLRKAENRIQAIGDQQTHDLPVLEIDQQRLAWMMGFDTYALFVNALDAHRGKVSQHFSQLIAAPQTEEDSAGGWEDLWLQRLSDEQCISLCQAYGFAECEQSLELIQRLQGAASGKHYNETNRERLNKLMPLLLAAVAQTDNPSVVLARIVPFIEAVLRRSAYLVLLTENPMALSQLVRLCSASPFIAEYLSYHPVLLDELLDPRTLYTPLKAPQLEQDLFHRVYQIDEDDLEAQMEVLRHFKQSNTLRVAAADISNAIPLMVVSDYLTAIAETILKATYKMAWKVLEKKHGKPTCLIDGQLYQPTMAIAGYGKLGGIELGYSSDLDIVFVHDSQGEKQYTDGKRQIDNAVFFSRLAQRIIHMLGTRTFGGVLYETDTRLRPNGASGLLVVSTASFEQYQMNDAWVWEHQAIVRARAVAGSNAPRAAFEDIRANVLRKPRDRDELRKEVCNMRQRMRDELGEPNENLFHLKQDFGGIADIEFLVQFGVLADANKFPNLTQFSDNIRLLADLAETGYITPDQAENLAEIYRQYRSRGHRLALQQEKTVVSAEEFTEQRHYVQQLWQALLEPGQKVI